MNVPRHHAGIGALPGHGLLIRNRRSIATWPALNILDGDDDDHGSDNGSANVDQVLPWNGKAAGEARMDELLSGPTPCRLWGIRLRARQILAEDESVKITCSGLPAKAANVGKSVPHFVLERSGAGTAASGSRLFDSNPD